MEKDIMVKKPISQQKVEEVKKAITDSLEELEQQREYYKNLDFPINQKKFENAISCVTQSLEYNADYEYTPLYYPTPTQVKYYNGSCFCEDGIALHNVIFSMKDGSTFKIDEIIKMAEKNDIHFDDAIVELEWKDYYSGDKKEE